MTMIPTEADHNHEGKVAGVALPPGLTIKLYDLAQPQRINEDEEKRLWLLMSPRLRLATMLGKRSCGGHATTSHGTSVWCPVSSED